jgi:Zn-dependent M28 family amino/carboxypeptidase
MIEGERNPFTDPAKHKAVRQYIEDRMASSAPVIRHTFEFYGIEGINLLQKFSGTDQCPPVLIGAHYDSVPGSPGADDNASAVAVLLELSRLLSIEPLRLPVWLVAFDLEEWRMQGSKALARSLKRERLKLSWMASLEMLGCRHKEPRTQRYPFPFGFFYPNTADFILLLGNTKAHGLLKRMARGFEEVGVKTQRFTVPFNGWVIPPTRLSDQSPFWDIGVAGVMVTDTAWNRNPNYHRSTDKMDTLDFEFMADITRGLKRILVNSGLQG